MFKWLRTFSRIAELESVIRAGEHQLDVARGEIERLAAERNHLMDALLRALSAAPMYATGESAVPKPIEREVARDHPAPRNMREFQSSLQSLEELERKAFS